MKLDEILSTAGPHKRSRRVGRGRGSGHGKTSGRGSKGFGARTGYATRPGFEGGQNPIIRRMPQRGFNNKRFAELVQIINVCDLEHFFEDGATVDSAALLAKGLISETKVTIKLLGKGDLKRKLSVSVTRASKSAAEKVAAAGGTLALTE
jgi:large subunit ribosomal protein L15